MVAQQCRGVAKEPEFCVIEVNESLTGVTDCEAVSREKQNEKKNPVFDSFIHPGTKLMSRSVGFRAAQMAIPRKPQ